MKDADANHPIYFDDIDGPYGEFGNFNVASIELDGHTWQTNKHYFQAQKFISHENHYRNILRSATPRETFNYARAHKSSVRSDWAQEKDRVMFKVCMAKFSQHPHLKHLLLSIEHRMLVEHTANDSYWGDGGDGSGRNQLGITLMELRNRLKHH